MSYKKTSDAAAMFPHSHCALGIDVPPTLFVPADEVIETIGLLAAVHEFRSWPHDRPPFSGRLRALA
jgi:hypothetical protein